MNASLNRSIAFRVGKHVNVSDRALHPVGALPRTRRTRSRVSRSTSSFAKRRIERRALSQLAAASKPGNSSPLVDMHCSGEIPSNVTAPAGQTARQCWQRIHASGFDITGVRESSILNAPKAQSWTHKPHFRHFVPST
jgi:hypothetical protein